MEVEQKTTKRIKKLTLAKLQRILGQVSPTEVFKISLNDYGIKELTAITEYPNVTKFDLSNNILTHLHSLHTFSSLTFLNLSHNSITGHGLDGIQSLLNLSVLNLSFNLIESIPRKIISALKNLKALILNNNSITSADWLHGLTSIETLILSHNLLSQGGLSRRALPTLAGLTKLSLSSNRLTQFPNVAELKKLVELRLANNMISNFPVSELNDTVGQLPGLLKTVDLGHNLFAENETSWSYLRVVADELRNLKSLNLVGNPIFGITNAPTEPIDDSDDARRSKNFQILSQLTQRQLEAGQAQHDVYKRKILVLFGEKLTILDGKRLRPKMSNRHLLTIDNHVDEEDEVAEPVVEVISEPVLQEEEEPREEEEDVGLKRKRKTENVMKFMKRKRQAFDEIISK